MLHGCRNHNKQKKNIANASTVTNKARSMGAHSINSIRAGKKWSKECAALIAQSVERLTLTREARVRFPVVAVGVVVLSKPLGTRAQLIRFTQPMNYEWVAGLVSAEGTACPVKPWSSFQCTGIHHAVRARTYKVDEHLAYALNKSTAPLPFFICKHL